MKLFLLLTLAITVMTQITKADTIDYWHVYYNKTKIEELNAYNVRDIIIKTDKVKSGDSIAVRYFRDTPGSDCITNLVIDDDKHHTVIARKGKGTGNPIAFALNDLVEFRKKNGGNYFEIYYFDNAISSNQPRRQLFRIKLE